MSKLQFGDPAREFGSVKQECPLCGTWTALGDLQPLKVRDGWGLGEVDRRPKSVTGARIGWPCPERVRWPKFKTVLACRSCREVETLRESEFRRSAPAPRGLGMGTQRLVRK